MDGLKARLSFDAVAYDYDDEYLTIDTDTHIININNLSRLFGVQYDGNSKLIKFRIRNQLSDIQKMQDSIVYINWIDSKGVKGQSIAINKTINNETCEFAWKVPFDALKNSRVLHFAMSAVITANSSSVINQKWSTQIASVIIPDGIYIKSYTPSSEEEDRIAQIYNELSKMINKQNEDLRADIDVERKRIDVLNNGGLIIKDELIENNIKAWLDEHPEATTTVQDGSITEKKLHPDLATKITDLQNSTKTYVNVNGLSISEIIDKYNEGAIPYIPNNITFSGEKLKSVKRFAGDGILITHQYIKNDGVKERGGIFTPSMYDNNFARDVNFFSEKESAIKLGHQKTGWLWGGENLFTDTSRPLLVPWGQVMKNPDCDLTENVKIYIGNLRVVAHHTNGTFSCIFNDHFDGCMLLPIYESSPDELIYKSLGYENGFRTIELTPTELENFCLHFYTGKASQTYYINRPDDCDWIAYKFSVFSDTIENTLLFNGGCDIKTNDGSDTKEIGGTRTLFVKNTPRDICFTNCPVDNLYYKVIDDIFENVVVSKRISVLDTKFNSVNERHIFNGFNVSDTSTSTFKFAVTKNKAYLLTACEVGNGIPNTDNSRAYILFIGDALKAIQIGGATDKFYISTSYSNNVVTITVPTKYCIVSLTKL